MKVLFFSPHSAIWVHAFPEALVAGALQQGGHQIVYITCGRQFKKYCIPMSAVGLKQEATWDEKEAVCKTCNGNKEIIKKSFKFKGYDLDDRLTELDKEKIKNILKNISRENFLDLIIDEIDIGRIALYEFLLQHKKSDLIFSDLEWKRYLTALENALYSFFACNKILDEERPDRIVTYNSLYSVNQVLHQITERRQITGYFLHAGGNLSNRLETLLIGKDHTLNFYKELINHWDVFKKLPCSEKILKNVTDHFLELLKGKSFLAYSSSKSKNAVNVRKVFKIKESQKVLTATMSSYDERFAAETVNAIPSSPNLVFATQIEWIHELIKFVEERPDLFLIIRVHPREFPNKREKVISEHALKLQEIFTNLPFNVKVNWPSDQISIYDLADVTDVFLNAWSSVGKEMSLFGLPVIIYSPDLLFYPDDLNYVAGSKEDYFKKIGLALKEGWSFERIRTTYRWYALEYGYSVVNISDNYRKKENENKNIFNRMFDRIKRKVFPYSQQQDDCKQRSLHLKAENMIKQLFEANKETILDLFSPENIGTTPLEVETKYLKEEIKRLAFAMYGKSEHNNHDSSLRKYLTSIR
ncbi:MAG: capsule biosynthesis protein [Nitrospiria bacterium]